MTAARTPPGTILITGASSGIGAALARCYAAPGRRLALQGRNVARLDAVAAECVSAGATVCSLPLDVTSAAPLADWIDSVFSDGSLDLVIANAGVSAGTGGGGEDAEQVRRIFAVNVDGTLNTALPAIRRMRGQPALDGRRGQIALMSSLAAFRGFPGAPAYCASKAAVRVWGEALRGSLQADGILVSVICPGFVESPMTAVNDFPMPFLMLADRAARIIRSGLTRDRARVAFPWPNYAAARLIAALPPAFADRCLVRLPKKG
ncbi:MAG: SDR family NAD(P)-dependent oxidoreductase [Proteobacteria bacterium]|nr:SDR family NAD(P)-dependent oxidoreductase [Pseudomonadota bacterium]